ncbi:alpha/beta hydrolase [Candidatus Gottesmanbacteria bacterium]|nr:alpha/beta hydrolase [Candidatus Gottesmanbacteria bacterium]
MKNAIILHGGPSKEEYYDPEAPSMSNAHWIPWLQGQLLKHDIPTATPEVPYSFDRNWEVWNREVERLDIGPETVLIGHSTGAGFFVKYLSIHKKLKVDRVILVAPWLDPDREFTKNFFDDFEIDPNLVSRTGGVIIVNSDNDQESVQKTVKILREKIKYIKYQEFHNYGHFYYEDMKTIQFPELLKTILENKIFLP